MTFVKSATALLAASVGAGTASAASITFDLTRNSPDLPAGSPSQAPSYVFSNSGIDLTVQGLSDASDDTSASNVTTTLTGGLGVFGNLNFTLDGSEGLVFTFSTEVILTEVTFTIVNATDDFKWKFDSGSFTDSIDLSSSFVPDPTPSATSFVFATADDDDTWRIDSITIDTDTGTGTVIPAPAAFAVGFPALLLAGLRRRRSA